jgi:hypothetical protein
LQGHLGDGDRPDQLGVIFTTTIHPERAVLPMLVECRAGALAHPSIQTALDRLADKRPVVLMDVQSHRTLVESAEPIAPAPHAA